MISAGQIADLAAVLGAPEGLAHVNHTIEALNAHLTDPKENFSRVELNKILRALNSLNAAILCMDQATRALLGLGGAGRVDCVG